MERVSVQVQHVAPDEEHELPVVDLDLHGIRHQGAQRPHRPKGIHACAEVRAPQKPNGRLGLVAQMEDEGEEVDLREGMDVSNEDGEALGTLAALLVEEDEEEAEFLLLKTGSGERLVPFDVVVGVGDGALVLDVTTEVLERYPLVKSGSEPSDEEIERAYEVYDETAGESED